MKKSMFYAAIIVLFILFGSACFAAEKEKDAWVKSDQAPVFVAKDFNGESVALTELAKKGPLVLVFLRGFG